MQAIKKAFSILSVSIVFCAACIAGENMNIKGTFAYTDGSSTIDTIDFSSSEVNAPPLYKSPELGVIDHLTRVDRNTILFGECPITGECILKQYSIDVGQSEVLRAGRLPSYIPNHEKLFFYDKASDSNGWLFVTSLGDINNATKIAEEPKWKTLPNGISQPVTIPIIQISNDEVIFVGKDEQLWLYNIANTELVPMDIKDCRPILWMDKRDQLLCSDWDTWDAFLLDIKTKNKVEMSDLKGAYGFVYVPSSDALIYGKTRPRFLIGEAYDIFIYSFADKKEERIKENSHLAGGVWVDDAMTQ